MAPRSLWTDPSAPDAAVLGRRLRAARRAAGLTQADLSSPDLSIAYISRIESGQRRPSPAVLAHIAQRLRLSVDELTATTGRDPYTNLRLSLSRAEQALHAGNPSEGVNLAGQVVIDADAVGLPDLGDHATVVQAGCHLDAHQPTQALALLETRFRNREQPFTPMRAHILTARCYRELGQPEKVIAIAEQAATVIEDSGLHDLPEALELASVHAAAYLETRQTERAAEVCRHALHHCTYLGQVPTTDHLVIAYRNASSLETQAGALAQASAHAHLAEAASEIANHATQLARLQDLLDRATAVDDPATHQSDVPRCAGYKPPRETPSPDVTG